MLKRRSKVRKFGSIQPQDLVYRPPLYSPDFPLILMWSEKSACTTVAKWFFAQTGLLKRALNHHRWIHVYENDVFKARKGYLEECASAIEKGAPVIKFVRNPYARLYSGYLETCSPRVLNQPNHWSTQTRSRVLEHLVGSQPGLEYAYTFIQFVDWLAEQTLGDLDPHLAPQFQVAEKKCAPRIIRVEDSENVFHQLEAEYGLKPTAGRKRIYDSGHHHNKTEWQAQQKASVLDVALPVSRSSSFTIYDAPPSTIASSDSGEKIRRIFKADFEAYGYSPVPERSDR